MRRAESQGDTHTNKGAAEAAYSEQRDKPLLVLHGEVRTPPFSQSARIEAGYLLRRLQQGENLAMPHSRPMPSLGPACHELRIRDAQHNWRIVYHLSERHVVLLEVFDKKTQQTPADVIESCQSRLASYQEALQKEQGKERTG